MRLSHFHTVSIVNGFRVLPLPRTWLSLANALR